MLKRRIPRFALWTSLEDSISTSQVTNHARKTLFGGRTTSTITTTTKTWNHRPASGNTQATWTFPGGLRVPPDTYQIVTIGTKNTCRTVI
ncbi:unnamed protein product [Acanthoscelides obtectus]|uniref:Uncharacterized protein n=1 Tax=Acanthoscelides obtectus TaxID=200917 RepID=A0A9P0LXB0_ACAOB|nr:unnamed protein product [Acanthoscelides obtectus]CAK1620826.1 hypothetical protein AOBTE_LOCUS593 [Acanthoscelides obtectus]